MKKFLVLFLFIVTLLSAQEIVMIGDHELTVPSDYFELKNAYIIMANLYLEAEDNLTIALGNNDKLQSEYDIVYYVSLEQIDTIDALTKDIEEELLPNIVRLEKRVTDLSRELEKFMKSDIISISPMIIYKHNTETYLQTIGIGINTIILEKFNIGIYYNLDFTYSVSVGYTIFSY